MSSRGVFTGMLAGAAMAGLFATGVVTGRASVVERAAPEKLDPAAIARVEDTSKAFVAAAKAAQPAVAHLIVTRLVRFRDPFEDFFSDPFVERFFRRRMPERVGRQTSMGSGVIVDPKGVILTNAHVVRDASEVVAKLPDGRTFKAVSIAVHDEIDLAVVKIEGKDLPVAELGDSNAVEVAQWVIAIGNPFGLEHTVTAGVISAIRKRGPAQAEQEEYIQTDAAINPGNSGGPLIDLKGRVVGINTAIYSKTGGYQGIGFAIPVNVARAAIANMTK
jgi:serine protease Do